MAAREFTNRMLELVEEGCFDKDQLIADLLAWCSERSVAEFVEAYELTGFADLLGDDDADDEFDEFDEAQLASLNDDYELVQDEA